jgi:hypothetical protein
MEGAYQGCQMAYFQTKKLQFGEILEGLAIEDVGIFCGHLVYFVAIWYILWPFGIFYGYLVYFMVIWYILWLFVIFCGHLVHFMVIWYFFTLWYIAP